MGLNSIDHMGKFGNPGNSPCMCYLQIDGTWYFKNGLLPVISTNMRQISLLGILHYEIRDFGILMMCGYIPSASGCQTCPKYLFRLITRNPQLGQEPSTVERLFIVALKLHMQLGN